MQSHDRGELTCSELTQSSCLPHGCCCYIQYRDPLALQFDSQFPMIESELPKKKDSWIKRGKGGGTKSKRILLRACAFDLSLSHDDMPNHVDEVKAKRNRERKVA